MGDYILKKKAVILVGIIGAFYIISGVWEVLHLLQGESIVDNLISLYRNYVYILGLLTILTGIGICFKLRISRTIAIFLAWWNLFTAPIIDVWWYVYTVLIKEYFTSYPLPYIIFYTVFVIILMTLARIYIIYALRISQAGYLFFKS